MILKLYRSTTGSWLISACGLNDPSGWTRFTPCQTHSNSDRVRFESAIAAAPNQLQLSLCKNLQKFGTSTFEYDWQLTEEEVLSHAISLADELTADLSLTDSPKAA